MSGCGATVGLLLDRKPGVWAGRSANQTPRNGHEAMFGLFLDGEADISAGGRRHRGRPRADTRPGPVPMREADTEAKSPNNTATAGLLFGGEADVGAGGRRCQGRPRADTWPGPVPMREARPRPRAPITRHRICINSKLVILSQQGMGSAASHGIRGSEQQLGQICQVPQQRVCDNQTDHTGL